MKPRLQGVSGIFSLVFRGLNFSANISLGVLVLVVLLVSVLTVKGVQGNPETFDLLKGPDAVRRDEDNLISEVRDKIELPQDERPTVATVTDPSQLEGQVFFKNAAVGDKILVYAGARKAILYRPGESRVVEVGNVNIDQQAGVAGVQNVNSEEDGSRFVIFNGTLTPNLTSTMETELLDNVEGVEVVGRSNAGSSDYFDTLVIDLSGGRGEQAEELADKLGAQVASLPDGERAPDDADFLIIVGSDRAPATPEPETSEE